MRLTAEGGAPIFQSVACSGKEHMETDRRKVKTRLAPSPTGDPHVGTAYQALFSWAWARKNGGSFVLRIEDTDRERSDPESERAIMDALRWLGLDWDEGPDKGGPCGPYRQSERLHMYQEVVFRLITEGHAYPCFCSKERLAELRRSGRSGSGGGYDRKCRDIPPEEATERVDAGEEFVVRMKVPLEGSCRFRDLLRGEIEKDWASIDDQVILKADGYPTYHMAVVVDDHLMGITHIIRGEEWINSVPKHVLLYRYLGWEVPILCHLPLLRNPDKSKLSKRKNPVSVDYYRSIGILPEALLNYLGTMGWRPTGAEDQEKFPLETMVGELELTDINLGGPVFDADKLRWLNGRYIREDLSEEELLERLSAWGLNRERFGRIVPLVKGRMTALSDWGPMTGHFFCADVEPDPEEMVIRDLSAEETAEVMQMVLWELERLRPWDVAGIEAVFRRMAELLDMRMKHLVAPFYVAVSGTKVSTPLFDSMAILGGDLSRVRVRTAVQVLGGLSKKRLKSLQKRYDRLTSGG